MKSVRGPLAFGAVILMGSLLGSGCTERELDRTQEHNAISASNPNDAGATRGESPEGEHASRQLTSEELGTGRSMAYPGRGNPLTQSESTGQGGGGK